VVQDIPQAAEECCFMAMAVTCGGLDEGTREQAENADKAHGRKAAAGFLALALGPACLVGRGVGHGDAGAVDNLDPATMPELVGGDVRLQALSEVIMNLVQSIQGEFGARLTIGAGVRTHNSLLVRREFAAPISHHFANRFAAGTVWGMHLIQKAPKDHLQRKDASAAVGSPGIRAQERLGNGESKEIAKLGEGPAGRELGERLCHGAGRWLPEKQGSERLKEGSGIAHP